MMICRPLDDILMKVCTISPQNPLKIVQDFIKVGSQSTSKSKRSPVLPAAPPLKTKSPAGAARQRTSNVQMSNGRPAALPQGHSAEQWKRGATAAPPPKTKSAAHVRGSFTTLHRFYKEGSLFYRDFSFGR